MKERPILFSAPMVRAILDGAKTQTRRMVKLPHHNPLGAWEPTRIGGINGGRTQGGKAIPEQEAIWHTRTGDCISYCNQPGNCLWVRETCSAEELESGLDGVRYLADNAFIPIANSQESGDAWIEMFHYRGKRGATVPPIHMPRWASRILLEVTGVRVERLQDISEADAVAEGIGIVTDHMKAQAAYGMYFCRRPDGKIHYGDSAVALFKTLWEQINGVGSWEANPWVWVIEFKRINALKAAA